MLEPCCAIDEVFSVVKLRVPSNCRNLEIESFLGVKNNRLLRVLEVFNISNKNLHQLRGVNPLGLVLFLANVVQNSEPFVEDLSRVLLPFDHVDDDPRDPGRDNLIAGLPVLRQLRQDSEA